VKDHSQKLVDYLVELNQLKSISIKQMTKIELLVEKLVENTKKESFQVGYNSCKEEYNIP
jgi:hypothetical protein